MTKKITISVPDDVAAFLEQQENVSGYLTALARRDLRRQIGLKQLADAGFNLTPEGVERMRAKFADARARVAAKQASQP
jgi:hypothetical protein